MNGFAKYLLLIVFGLPLALCAQDDEIQQLKQEMKRLEEEINFTKKKINEVKREKRR
jgi:cell division protein FtsB